MMTQTHNFFSSKQKFPTPFGEKGNDPILPIQLVYKFQPMQAGLFAPCQKCTQEQPSTQIEFRSEPANFEMPQIDWSIHFIHCLKNQNQEVGIWHGTSFLVQ